MDAETTLAPIVSSNLNELISARLKDYIVQNGLRAGDKLPTEEQLSQRLGVSRTVVREALRSLEALGVVEARQGYGRVVCNFNFQAILNNLSYGLVFQNNDILQITDIRKALDSYFTGPAIERLTDEDRAELVHLVGIMEERCQAGLGISEQDYRFHQLLFQRCNNPLALQLFEITWTVRLNAYDRDSALRESPPGTAHEHAAILEAILRNDVAAARQLLLDHHWNTEERFRGRIRQEMRRIREEV